MKLTVYNGSPRGKSSNTRILLEHFLEGFLTAEGNTYELAYLVRVKESADFIKLFQEAEQVLLVFPLYTDAMPAIVKAFIESIEPLCGRSNNPDIAFIVQGGLPEATHARYVGRYLKKLSKRLGCKYRGTVTKGGIEGIQEQPAMMTRKLFKSFYELGKAYGQRGEFDEQMIRDLAQPERLSRFKFWLLRFSGHRLFWNPQLKKNKAFAERFAKPYTK